jgi:hypothetical protein
MGVLSILQTCSEKGQPEMTTTEGSELEYTLAEQQEAAKQFCDAGYFRKYLTGEDGYQGDASIIHAADEVRKLIFSNGMLTIEFIEGTVLRIAVDPSNIAVDTKNFVPLPEDIDHIRRSQK